MDLGRVDHIGGVTTQYALEIGDETVLAVHLQRQRIYLDSELAKLPVGLKLRVARVEPLCQDRLNEEQTDEQDGYKKDNGEKDNLRIGESEARLLRKILLVADDQLIPGCQPVGKCLSDSQRDFLLFALRDRRSILPGEV